jgi:hypothetical protein
MNKKEYEIVERSSGYWITDGLGVLNGPYDSVEEANRDVPQGQLQYPLLLGEYKSRHNLENLFDWNNN